MAWLDGEATALFAAASWFGVDTLRLRGQGSPAASAAWINSRIPPNAEFGRDWLVNAAADPRTPSVGGMPEWREFQQHLAKMRPPAVAPAATTPAVTTGAPKVVSTDESLRLEWTIDGQNADIGGPVSRLADAPAHRV